MSRIRPYRPADRAAMYDICVRTADAGADATGILSNDELWGDVYAVPYVERHPDLAWVVEAEDGRAIGYIVATDDTDAFARWFRDEWWPQRAQRYPRPGEVITREDRMVESAYSRAPGDDVHAGDYPAHLHIDLLPETQGQGLGRLLVETLFAELRRRGVTGLHLGMDPNNTGAAAFYERLGMERLPEGPGAQSYGVRFGG
ncbi:GNAT family N-acetyltransferase [Microbacterium sp. LWH12-1.2]|uniref:GNAT family N-acetyltransferase n=1 Tax=Microbacterium sp. LWH12-1.2 TaxID=3135259 RepID=UPI00343B21E3